VLGRLVDHSKIAYVDYIPSSNENLLEVHNTTRMGANEQSEKKQIVVVLQD